VTHRTLVLGGARSGKSGYAEGLLPSTAPVTYVATARRDPADTEWEARIARHIDRRPTAGQDRLLLVDDLAAWLTGVLDTTEAWEGGPDALAGAGRHVDGLVTAVTGCAARLVLVSAEVGLGVVPETRSGRLFRDELGSCNARLAQVCDEVLLLVAGIPVQLNSPRR
jgi:adenosylcobinamide kinase/adenosylcobinamide-phosphate guanylyltransferase